MWPFIVCKYADQVWLSLRNLIVHNTGRRDQSLSAGFRWFDYVETNHLPGVIVKRLRVVR